mgnify:CR=1 FL=1
MKMKEKVVIITGGGKGIGRGVAEAFGEEGANLVITGRHQESLDQAKQELENEFGIQVLAIQADGAVESDVKKVIEQTVQAFGHIDVLINNAGIWPTAYVVDMKPEDFERTIRVNLEVPYLLCQKFVQEKIAAQQKGKIVNIVSQAAFHGSTTGHAHYAASKAGLVSFSISLAREVAKYGINVNMVAPGMVRTPMTEEALKAKSDYYNGRIPIGRVAEPEEVAQAAVFLASKCADYYTGITFDATGGMLMR